MNVFILQDSLAYLDYDRNDDHTLFIIRATGPNP